MRTIAPHDARNILLPLAQDAGIRRLIGQLEALDDEVILTEATPSQILETWRLRRITTKAAGRSVAGLDAFVDALERLDPEESLLELGFVMDSIWFKVTLTKDGKTLIGFLHGDRSVRGQLR